MYHLHAVRYDARLMAIDWTCSIMLSTATESVALNLEIVM